MTIPLFYNLFVFLGCFKPSCAAKHNFCNPTGKNLDYFCHTVLRSLQCRLWCVKFLDTTVSVSLGIWNGKDKLLEGKRKWQRKRGIDKILLCPGV